MKFTNSDRKYVNRWQKFVHVDDYVRYLLDVEFPYFGR